LVVGTGKVPLPLIGRFLVGAHFVSVDIDTIIRRVIGIGPRVRTGHSTAAFRYVAGSGSSVVTVTVGRIGTDIAIAAVLNKQRLGSKPHLVVFAPIQVRLSVTPALQEIIVPKGWLPPGNTIVVFEAIPAPEDIAVVVVVVIVVIVVASICHDFPKMIRQG